jgi:hypothetical protein
MVVVSNAASSKENIRVVAPVLRRGVDVRGLIGQRAVPPRDSWRRKKCCVQDGAHLIAPDRVDVRQIRNRQIRKH